MAYQPKRWMTRDFVFTAPSEFPDVFARELERFDLRPYPGGSELPSLFVLARDADTPWDLNAMFETVAADFIGPNGPDEWSLVPVHVLGREGRYGTGADPSAANWDAGVTVVRGRDDRVWAFGWRSVMSERSTVELSFNALMQGLQARSDRIGEKRLRSQLHSQEEARQATIAAIDTGQGTENLDPDPADIVWDERFAAALGESGPSAVSQFWMDAAALVEEPFGEEAPLGASRIGGGPDLPADMWPSNERGMRHPFLMQIDLAEIKAACGPMQPLPDEGLLSFFVHGDALLLDVVYTLPGTSVVRHPMTEAIIEASAAAVAIAADLGPGTQPGVLPHSEGDLVTAELMADGHIGFAHTPDPVWAVGEPGAGFGALSDERWATTAYARLRPRRSRSFDVTAAETRIEETEAGSPDDLTDTHEALERALTGPLAGLGLPQSHQMSVMRRSRVASIAGTRRQRQLHPRAVRTWITPTDGLSSSGCASARRPAAFFGMPTIWSSWLPPPTLQPGALTAAFFFLVKRGSPAAKELRMPSHLRAALALVAVGLLAAVAIPAAAAGSDDQRRARPGAPVSITGLRELCSNGSAETPMSFSADANVILHRHDQARAACDKLIDAAELGGRDLAEVLLDRADLEAPGQADAYARALADYDRAIALAPDLAAAYWRRGKANLLYGRNLAAALRDLDAAIRLEPSQAEFYVTRASILSWDGRPELAMADLNHALTVDPRSEHALTNRGLAYFNDGDISRALADFDAALRLAPDDSDLYSFRSAARRRAGDEVGAKADEATMMELVSKGGQ
ncbi:tetratricopeptide repeat protein [Neorhizobium galegae]|uniref:tetratricopeptide repeat protein n=1 Tax=Neorhizobium galegae TaxID=399 RepID=UPI000622059E|nr:tetratricopeptide repeat protein [Neorhizobium galegae]MCQ1810723.1 DUF1963 domain-containing protein [Neorhizobium galegae]CDZ64302.1 Hypothetical protein NGAL_HAMBI2566_59850 [Neorhizobium galegae bv. orientalis]